MGKRDLVARWLPRSRSNRSTSSLHPPPPPSSQPHLRFLTPSGQLEPNTQDEAVRKNATSHSQAVGPSHSSTNQALQDALEKYLADIPAKDKDAFRDSFRQMTDASVLEQVEHYDRAHKSRSSLRPHTQTISRFLAVLTRFTDVVAIAIQANPDVSSIVVGICRGVLTIATSFVGFFDKLSQMVSRVGDYLAALTEYSKSVRHSELIKDSLVRVYLSVLDFFRSARQVFVDDQGTARKWTSWRVFWRVQWMPFEQDFGDINDDIQHRLDVLKHAAQAVSLETSLEAARADGTLRQKDSVRERERFLTWLSSYPFEETHSKIFEKKHPSTGEWLVQTKEFQQWFSGQDSGILSFLAKPGSGKSVLTSNVIEYITSRCAFDENVGIAFAYYEYGSTQMAESTFIMSALLKQICRQNTHIPEGFLRVKNDAFPSSHLANADTFFKAAEHYRLGEVFIIIDALDECPRNRRPELFKCIRQLMAGQLRVKLFVASRFEVDVEEALNQLGAVRIATDAGSVQTDIRNYVEEETKLLMQGLDGRRLYISDEALQDKVVDTLSTKADGLFLWVNLQLLHLCEESLPESDYFVEKALNSLPDGLDATFERSLTQIIQQEDLKRRLAFSILRWVMYAERPLTVEELLCAIATEASEDADHIKQILSPRFTATVCANLIEVTTIHEATEVFRPIHYSVQEYVGRRLDLLSRDRLSGSSQRADEIEALLAKTCIEYLTQTLRTSAPCKQIPTLCERVLSHRFLWYAARNFDGHLARSSLPRDLIDCCESMLQRSNLFLASVLQVRNIRQSRTPSARMDIWSDFHKPEKDGVDRPMVVFSTKLYDISQFQAHWKEVPLSPMLLHSACLAGLTSAVKHLLQIGHSSAAVDNDGVTPLYHAVSGGHVKIVQYLIEHDAPINARGGRHGSALQAASYLGHEKIVRALLDAGADVNLEGGHQGSPLQAALDVREPAIAKLLLERGADPNTLRQRREWTVLQRAANWSDVWAIELLLDFGADINRDSSVEGPPLFQALESDARNAVIVLIAKGADVDYCSTAHGGALQYASHCCSGDMVQLLIDQKISVDALDSKYGTALQAACRGGREDIVEMLIANGADVEACDTSRGTPLQLACKGGYQKVVELLLEKGANVNARACEDTGTPLQEASTGGHLEIVKLLIAKGVGMDERSQKWNFTALQAAAKGHHKAVVDCLLNSGADINAAAGEHGTVLHAAWLFPYDGLQRHVLSRGADPRESVREIVRARLETDSPSARYEWASFYSLSRMLMLAGLTQDLNFCAKVYSTRCDMCRELIRGTGFACRECLLYDACRDCMEKYLITRDVDSVGCQDHKFIEVACQLEEDRLLLKTGDRSILQDTKKWLGELLKRLEQHDACGERADEA